MPSWRPRPRVWFGSEPPAAGLPLAFTPADDGPDPDRAERARHAAAHPVDVQPEDSPLAGRYEQLRPAPPEPRLLGAEGNACRRCAGLEQVIRELKAERDELRGQLARHELAASRTQRLRPSGRLP